MREAGPREEGPVRTSSGYFSVVVGWGNSWEDMRGGRGEGGNKWTVKLCTCRVAAESDWVGDRGGREGKVTHGQQDGGLLQPSLLAFNHLADRSSLIGHKSGHKPGVSLSVSAATTSSSFIQPSKPSSYVSLFLIAPILQCPLTLTTSLTPSSSRSRPPFSPSQSRLSVNRIPTNIPTVAHSSALAQKSREFCHPSTSFPALDRPLRFRLSQQCLTSTHTLPLSPIPNLILLCPPRMIQVSSHPPTNMTTEMRLVTSPLRQARRPKWTGQFVEEAVKVRHNSLPLFLLVALTVVLESSLRSVS